MGEVLLSELGLFIGSGPIKAASLHTAHSKDGIVETLAHLGVAKPLAEHCKKALTNGKILLSVHAHDERTERKASSIIKRASAALASALNATTTHYCDFLLAQHPFSATTES